MEADVKFPIVTLCGSTRFRVEFEKYASEFTMCKCIVLMPNVFTHANGYEVSAADKKMLDAMHMKKIDMADVVFIVNPNGYIGLSTKDEIYYAVGKKKPILFQTALQDDALDSVVELCEAEWGEADKLYGDDKDFTPEKRGLLGIWPKEATVDLSFLWLDVMNRIDTVYPVI